MNQQQAAEPVLFHPALRLAARIVSYIFHPLFIPVYMGWFFIYELRLFKELDNWNQSVRMIHFFVIYTLLPLVTVLIAKGLGFVQTVYLKTQKDRIIPYMAIMIFYFWMWYVSKNLSFPKESVGFSLAVFLATCVGAFFNSYIKVSMHGLSVGVVITLLFILSLHSKSNFGPYLSIALFISGLVCTARLLNNDHHPFEVYAGLFLGALSQLVAWAFV